ncbi:MAG: putative bifunctional diguanylate cyclase/phosphodiesterase [Leptospirales bacterium]
MSEKSIASFLNEGMVYIISRMSDAVVIKDGGGHWVFANSDACRLFQLPEDGSWEGLPDLAISCMSAEYLESFQALFQEDEKAWLERKKIDSFKTVSSRGTGKNRHLKITRIPFFNSDGTRRALVSIIHDLTDFSELEDALRTKTKEEKTQSILDSLSDGVIVVDLSIRVKYMNYAAELMLGYRLDEIQDKPLEGILPFRDDTETHTRLNFSSALQRFLERSDFRDLKDDYIVRRDGRKIAVEETISLLRDREGVASGLVVVLRDATLRRELLKRLNLQAYYDNLTGVYNRISFNDKLKQSIARSSRSRHSFALVMLDLDGFKNVNDSMGHAAGDELLKAVSSRLSGLLRETDILARLGGDEFIIIQEGIEDLQKGLHPFIQKIAGAFEEPFMVNSHEVFVSTSIGVSVFPQDGRNEEQLLHSADQALYEAKKSGKNTWRFFDTTFGSRIEDRINLENILKLSPELENFQIVYLPKVNLESGKITGLEALLRLKKGDRVIPPSIFIPIAEESGRMGSIDLWVLRSVISQLNQWRNSGFPELKASINISAQLFFRPEFVPELGQILSSFSLPPGSISVEVSESTLGKSVEKSREILHKLKELGVHLILDSFGSGFPSLVHLKKFPIDMIKMDSIFTNEIESSAKDKIILESLIRMGKNLSLGVCAKGVETDQERDFLQKIACEEAQGFLFSLPLQQSEVAGLLRGSRPSVVKQPGKKNGQPKPRNGEPHE